MNLILTIRILKRETKTINKQKKIKSLIFWSRYKIYSFILYMEEIKMKKELNLEFYKLTNKQKKAISKKAANIKINDYFFDISALISASLSPISGQLHGR